MTTTADRLQQALEIREMRQAELARKTGIAKSSICTYLTGEYEPKQKNIYKLARALNVDEAWLMGYDVPMERKNPSSPEENNLSKIKQDVIDKVLSLKDEDVQLLLQIAEKILQAKE